MFGFLVERGAARPPRGPGAWPSAPSCSSRCRWPRSAASGCCRSTSAARSTSGASACASSSTSSEEPPAAEVDDARSSGSQALAGVQRVRYVVARPRRWHRSSARSARRPTWRTSSRGTRCPPPLEVTPDRRRRDARGHARARAAARRRCPRWRRCRAAREWVESLAQWPAALPARRPRRRRGAGAGRHPHRDHRDHAGAARAPRRDGDHAAGRRPRERDPAAAAAAGHGAGPGRRRRWRWPCSRSRTRSSAPRLEPLLTVTLGLAAARSSCSPRRCSRCIGGGAVLGALGGLLAPRAGRRHERGRPRAARSAPAGAVARHAVAWPARRPGARSATSADIGEKQQTCSRRRSASTRSARRRPRPRSARPACWPSSKTSSKRLARQAHSRSRRSTGGSRRPRPMSASSRARSARLESAAARARRRRSSRRLRALYKLQAQGGALPLLLSGDDPVAQAVQLRHLTTLATVDARLIREYRVTSEGLADRKSRVEARQTGAGGAPRPRRMRSGPRPTGKRPSGGCSWPRSGTSAPTTSGWSAS